MNATIALTLAICGAPSVSVAATASGKSKEILGPLIVAKAESKMAGSHAAAQPNVGWTMWPTIQRDWE
jgi:hypothetical protein